MNNIARSKSRRTRRLIRQSAAKSTRRYKSKKGLWRKTPIIVFVLLVAALFQLDQSSALRTLFGLKSGSSKVAGLSNVVSGVARVVDGDTIKINGQRVRLYGIDAPEARQSCTSIAGARVQCGVRSTRYLKRLLRNDSLVTCKLVNRDRYGRFVGDCRGSDGKSLSAEMVRAGQALDWPKYSRRAYSSQQNQARAERLGL